MKSFLVRLIINTLALVIVVEIIPGINVDRWQTAILSALVLGLVNTFLRPLVMFFTLPLNILSLGLFTLVINGLMFYLASKLVPGFTVNSFWNAFWGALFFSMINFLLNLFVNPHREADVHFYKFHSPRRLRYKEVIDIDKEK